MYMHTLEIRQPKRGRQIYRNIKKNYEKKVIGLQSKESCDRKLDQRGANKLSRRGNGTRHEEHFSSG